VSGVGVSRSGSDVYYAVYVSDSTSGLWKVPKGGGKAEMVGPYGASQVTVDGQYVYTNGVRYPLGGGASERTPTGFSFAMDDTSLYSADFTEVTSAPKGSMQLTILAAGRNGAQGISTAGSWVYWADYSGDQVLRVPKDGGTVEVLETGHFPRQVVADCVEAFATIGNYGGPVVAARLDAGHATRTVAPFGNSLAIDDGSLYVLGPSVYRVPLDGSSDPQRIGAGFTDGATGGAVQIAVDDTNVYWAADDGVWAAPK
jgi:hypothetical protein